MKISKFNYSQILAILKQAEAGARMPELCIEHDMSSVTAYKCRAKFDMNTSIAPMGIGAKGGANPFHRHQVSLCLV